MALRRWRGATSTAWGTAANWAEAAVPVDGDDVLFDAAPTTYSPTTDIDQNGVNLKSLRVSNAFTGSIGTTATPLIIGADVCILDAVSIASAGFIHLKGDTTDKIEQLVILSGNPNATIKLDGKFTDVIIYRGNVDILAGITVGTSLIVGSVGTYNNDLTLDIAAGATLPATINVFGGTTTSALALTTLNLSGGTFIQAANVTTATVYGGLLYLSSGTITTLNLYGGGFSRVGYPSQATITSCSMFGNCTYDIRNGCGNTTQTNAIVYYGGTISLDEGRTVAFNAP